MRAILRILLSSLVLACLLVPPHSASAQGQSLPLPQPTKALCIGDPDLSAPATCPTATSLPAFTPVFYAVTLQATQTGTFTLIDPSPSGFTALGFKCIVTAGPATGQIFPPNGNGSGQASPYGPLTLQTGQTVVCFISGEFTIPGASASNVATIGDAAGHPVSPPGTINAVVDPSTVLLGNLSVSKTVSPATADISAGPQTLTYTIVLTNNGPGGIYLGQVGQLIDYVSTPANSVPMQVQVVPGSVQCVSTPTGPSPPNTTCIVPPSSYPTTWTDATTTPAALAMWNFPPTGYIPAGGSMTVTFQVQLRLYPDLFCAKGGEKLKNTAFISLSKLPGVTVTDIDPTNNTGASPDVAVTTGQNIDPDCGIPTPGPIKIKKVQIPPTGTIPWGTPVHYLVTIQNTDPTPITVNLSDRVMEWWGTPQFHAEAVNWSCVPATVCAPPNPPGPTVALTSYFASATVWQKPGVAIPGAVGNTPGQRQFEIWVKYMPTTCDSYDYGGDKIRNYARASYMYGSPPTQKMAEAVVETTMAPVGPCKMQVKKTVIDVDKAEFGVPLEYHVSYHNSLNTPVHVGTLIDAVRLIQPNYATQMPFDTGSYNCSTTAGTVSGGLIAASGLSGNIVYTPSPSQGARIINAGPRTFSANATLSCDVKFTPRRPLSGDPYCMGSGDPRLENIALMDVSDFYNSNVPWPPTGPNTYNPAINPVTTPQPSVLANWQSVSVHLPKCYKVVVNKSVSPTITWAPGGQTLFYTLSYTNVGPTNLTGYTDSNGWNGLVIGDNFLPGSPYAPTGPVTVFSSCGAQWPNTNGVPNWSSGAAANGSVLPIANLPPGCTVKVLFPMGSNLTPSLPPTGPGEVCNKATAGIASIFNTTATDTADWYANITMTNVLNAQACALVLKTNDLTVAKTVVNNAGVTLPSTAVSTVIVTCTTPLPGNTPPSFTNTSYLQIPDNGTRVIHNIPVGSTCSANEWSPPSFTGNGSCKTPATAVWQLPPVYNPGPTVVIAAPPTAQTVTLTNTVSCVTPPLNTLTVTKTFDSAATAAQMPPGAIFPVTVTCDPTHTYTLHLTGPNYTGMVTALPVGLACQISEQAPTGTNLPSYCKWLITYPSGDHMTIPATGNPALLVKNALICNPPVDLGITKSAPKPSTTMPAGYYDYTITLTSLGGPFTIPPNSLLVSDTGYGMVGGLTPMTAVPTTDWVCSTTSATLGCLYTGTGPTTVGQVMGTFTVHYLPFMPRPYVNCANVTFAPTAGVIESNLDNNQSCVTGFGPLPRVDLSITKTGPAPLPGFPGQVGFTVTVKNSGPAFTPTQGAIVVQDTATGMVGGFTGVAASPASDWNCQVGGVSGSCAYTGTAQIGAGQVLGTITIPYHNASLADFTNCATVSLTPMAPFTDAISTNNKACVTVTNNKLLPVTSTPPICDPATTVLNGGVCMCRFPAMTQSSASTCSCPSGTQLLAGKGCIKPTECRPPMVASPTGTGCGCPGGTVPVGGACIIPIRCAAPMVASPTGAGCGCPVGTVLAGRECVKAPPRCTPPMVASPSGAGCACPVGTVLAGRECVKAPPRCTPPMVANPAGMGCTCPPGTILAGRECVKAPQACPPPMVSGTNGNGCICPPGTISHDGQCMRQVQCAPPMVADQSGQACVCPAGTTNERGTCVKHEGGVPSFVPGVRLNVMPGFLGGGGGGGGGAVGGGTGRAIGK